MYIFKADRVIEFDGLLSANTLVEFLLDVSQFNGKLPATTMNQRSSRNNKPSLSPSISFCLSLVVGGASGGDRKCPGAESL